LGVDRLPFPSQAFQCRIADLTVSGVVESLFDAPVDAVFHLAGRTSVLQSVADPQAVYRANVETTQALLEQCRRARVPAFILASTNAVVGNSAAEAMNESAPLRPLTPYGATKAAAEMLCSAYGQSYGMAASAVRMTNVYGPGMAGKDSFIIRLLRAAAGQQQVEIYGDGGQARDYVYVDDAVAGLLLAWDRKHQGPLIIGSGETLDVLAVHRLACAVTGTAIPIRHRAAPGGEMRSVRVDLSLARALGFRPGCDLARGLASTWQALRGELGAAVRA